jgi:predicted amidohydrolase YtcJ
VVTQASDWPVSYQNNPFIGMEIGITRKAVGTIEMNPQNYKEALSKEEMLEVLTINGAYQLHLEQEIGTLEVGKRANFIVLNKDIKEVSADNIAQIKVLANYIDGVAYH